MPDQTAYKYECESPRQNRKEKEKLLGDDKMGGNGNERRSDNKRGGEPSYRPRRTFKLRPYNGANVPREK